MHSTRIARIASSSFSTLRFSVASLFALAIRSSDTYAFTQRFLKASPHTLKLPFERSHQTTMPPSVRETRLMKSPSSSEEKSPAKKTETKRSPRSRKKTTAKAASPSTKAKKKKAPAHQVLTERDELPKLWNDEKAKEAGSMSTYSFVALSVHLRRCSV